MISDIWLGKISVADRIADADVVSVLAAARVVAVVGASQSVDKPAHYVPAYLHEHGYRIIPVNPHRVGHVMWGEPVRASLTDVEEMVDIVNVFRPSAELTKYVSPILDMRFRPRAAWFQLGIRNDAVASLLIESGIEVIQDRCMLVDHRDLLGHPIS